MYEVSVDPHPHQHLVLAVFFLFFFLLAIGIGKWFANNFKDFSCVYLSSAYILSWNVGLNLLSIILVLFYYYHNLLLSSWTLRGFYTYWIQIHCETCYLQIFSPLCLVCSFFYQCLTKSGSPQFDTVQFSKLFSFGSCF